LRSEGWLIARPDCHTLLRHWYQTVRRQR